MRIILGNCTSDKVAETLKIIETEYGMELGGVNIYCNMLKENRVYNFYDMNNEEKITLSAGSNVLIRRKLQTLSCMEQENVDFLHMVSNLLDGLGGLEDDQREDILDYLRQVIEVQPKTLKLDRYQYSEEEVKEIGKKAKFIMDVTAMCPSGLRAVYHQHESDEFEDIGD